MLFFKKSWQNKIRQKTSKSAIRFISNSFLWLLDHLSNLSVGAAQNL